MRNETQLTLSRTLGWATNPLVFFRRLMRRTGASIAFIMAFSLLVTVGAVSGDQSSMAAAPAISLGTLNGPNGFRIDGRNPGDQAGSSLKNAGDVNGDGLDDYIIGAAAANPDGMQGGGETYVVFGTTSNPPSLALSTLNGNNGFRLVGATYNDEAGKSVSGAGDINNDGYSDLIIGAPGVDPNDLSEAGAIYVVFGGSQLPARVELSELNGSTGFRINGIAENDRAGTSVGHAGDVNGDGYDDILVGAPDAAIGAKEAAGHAYVIFGRASFASLFELSGLNGSNGFQMLGVAAESYAGNVVNTAGDVNGDGYGDILVGAWKTSRGGANESGAVYIIFGGPSFTAKLNLADLTGTNGLRLDGIAADDNAGRSADSAGDVNGDGLGDVIVGAPFADDYTGEAYVVFGRPSFPAAVGLDDLTGANGFRLAGSEVSGGAGMAVGAADVNGDGLDDPIVGVSAAGTGGHRFAGKVYVVFGGNSFPSTVELTETDENIDLQFDGAAGGNQVGQTISGAGDVNGDGYDEFLIGAPNAGPGVNSDVGYIYLVQGGPTLGVTMPVTHPGSPNDDTLTGSGAADVMLGGRGQDQISGVAGDDALKGGSGDDILIGGPGGDRLVGGNGEDTASYAGSAVGVSINLFTSAASGGDAAGDHFRTIEGLIGSAAADTLKGDAGDNHLVGAGGDDNLTGGRGNDAFGYAPQSANDTITDFTPGAGSDDYLDFSAYNAIHGVGDLGVQAQGADTLVTLPGGETIRLVGVQPSSMHPDDYRFAGAPLARNDQYDTPVNTALTVAAPGVLGNDDNPLPAAMSAVLVAAPAHGTVTLQATGSFTYTPASNYLGADEFTYRANNGQASNVARVTINVVLQAPTAVDDAYIVELGQTLNVAAPGVLTNDQNPGGPPLQANIMEMPVNGTIVFNTDGSFSYTPEVDYSTQDSFTYEANNGLGSNVATVVITILDPDGPPVAADDNYSLQKDKSLSVGAPGVLGNDVNPLPGAMTALLGTEPIHGTVTLNANGAFNYTPQTGYTGQDTFTYRANNGRSSEEATVRLTIGEEGYTLQLPVVLGE